MAWAINNEKRQWCGLVTFHENTQRVRAAGFFFGQRAVNDQHRECKNVLVERF